MAAFATAFSSCSLDGDATFLVTLSIGKPHTAWDLFLLWFGLQHYLHKLEIAYLNDWR